MTAAPSARPGSRYSREATAPPAPAGPTASRDGDRPLSALEHFLDEGEYLWSRRVDEMTTGD